MSLLVLDVVGLTPALLRPAPRLRALAGGAAPVEEAGGAAPAEEEVPRG